MSKIKICGLRRAEDIEFANITRPDMIGFIFAKKSRRYIDADKAASLKEKLLAKISAVGVFVNEAEENIKSIAQRGIIDAVQLHGSEDEDYIKRIKESTGLKVIKAFSVSSYDDVKHACRTCADLILLDNGSGGTGDTFSWEYLAAADREYILAGGLNCGNIETAVQKFSPYAVDVSSGVETDGKKDFLKMKMFTQIVRNTRKDR